MRTTAYTPNLLNQYQNRSVPGAADILGATHGSASVTINGAPAAYRRNEFYQGTVTLDNSAGPVDGGIEVSASLNGSTINSSGKVLLPPSTESFIHDDDGNLTSDGLWTYTWDAESRLVQMVSRPGVPTTAKRQLDFEYDFRGRRIRKTVSTTIDGTTYGNAVSTKFLHDGWNLIAEVDANNTVLRSYVWGLDLSGTVEGAGGIGGLLFMRSGGGGAQFASYDGNGNVMALVDAATAASSAQYEYGPFGELVRTSGSLKDANPFGFSTKFRDPESGFAYYGYRYYSASLGRWASADPLGELPGANIFAFAGNEAPNSSDFLGLFEPLPLPLPRPIIIPPWIGPPPNTMPPIYPPVPVLPPQPMPPPRPSPADVPNPDPSGNAPPARVSSECKEYLCRFGTQWEGMERLEEQATAALKAGYPHGVSTFLFTQPKPGASCAPKFIVELHFRVEQSGPRRNHYTVVLPQPVSSGDANLFNTVFGRKLPPGIQM